MKIYKAAIIGLGPSGLAVNKILYEDSENDVIAFENKDINERDNYFGFWYKYSSNFSYICLINLFV